MVTLAILAPLFLAACHSSVHRLDEANATVVRFQAQDRAAFVLDPASTAKFCAEPSPDIAQDILKKALVSAEVDVFDYVKGGTKIDASKTARVVELAGRTELLMLIREMLYRLCEMSINVGDDTERFNLLSKKYQSVLNLASEIAQADTARATAQADEARTDLLKAMEEAGRQHHTLLADRKVIRDLLIKDGKVDCDRLKAALKGSAIGTDYQEDLIASCDSVEAIGVAVADLPVAYVRELADRLQQAK
jgi:hypothetical protein